jgi:hypothetical protein
MVAIPNTNATPVTSVSLRRATRGQGRRSVIKVKIFTRAEAIRLLGAGLRRGLFSVQERNGWPQNIWSVTDGGQPLEAQLEGDGVYHGYPMPDADPFREEVLQRWNTQ